MGESSKIEWTDATVNWWIGCTEVSAACDHCYARGLANRYGWAVWGQGQPRTLTKGAKATAYKLERRAVREGRRLKVFTNSLSDFFDAEVPDSYRDDAFAVIDDTPHLDWLILTKRPQVARRYLGGKPARPNVWLGTTTENQKMYDLRWPILRDTPAAVRFISYEPALGDLYVWGKPDWIICGGESGRGARMMDHAWARSTRDQCKASGIAFFMKQMTGKAPIPPDLVIRQFPAGTKEGS